MVKARYKEMMYHKGFTLIELVVVIVIIGILASIALPIYTNVVERSRVSEALTNLKAILDSQMRYALETDQYAGDFDHLDINVTGKYFTFDLGPADYSNGIGGEIIACATRNDLGYTIDILENGTFQGTGLPAGINLP